MGGPVWIPKVYNGHDKTFFFFNYEQYRNNGYASNVTTLPTDAERSGDFSALLGGPTGATSPCDNTTVLKGQIFDPFTASCPTGFVGGSIAFPNNQVPLSSVVAQNVLGFLTAYLDKPPSAGNLNGLINNFLFLFQQTDSHLHHVFPYRPKLGREQ